MGKGKKHGYLSMLETLDFTTIHIGITPTFFSISICDLAFLKMNGKDLF